MDSLISLYERAVQNLSEGDWLSACDAAQLGLQADPDHGRFHEVLGVAAYQIERYGAAIHHLEMASMFVPLHPGSQLALADLYLRFGQWDLARVILFFLAEDNRCPEALMPELAKTLGRAGAYELALEVCNRLTNLQPQYHPAWFGIAFYLGRLGRSARELLAPLRTAFDLNPNAIPYRVNLAAVYACLGLAVDAYQLIVDLRPECVGCRRLCQALALACENVGDFLLAELYRNRSGGILLDGEENVEWSESGEEAGHEGE